MSKTITFKGSITPGTDEQRIKLSTMNGKTGYMIKKFQIIGSAPGGNNAEYVCQIFRKSGEGPSATVDFTNDALLAVAYNSDSNGWGGNLPDAAIVIDRSPINQDIYISGADAAGTVIPFNYYIELETMTLSDVQATQLTLRSLRTITS
jgi:hypothetical protein